MNEYTIAYKDKVKKVFAETAIEAVEKYGRRVVFGGNTIFYNLQLKMVDADTRGKRWAEFLAGSDNDKCGRFAVTATLIN